MIFCEVCDENSFIQRDMDFPVGRSRAERAESLPAYLRSIRDNTQELVDKGTLILGCDAETISNKTAIGDIKFFPKII